MAARLRQLAWIKFNRFGSVRSPNTMPVPKPLMVPIISSFSLVTISMEVHLIPAGRLRELFSQLKWIKQGSALVFPPWSQAVLMWKGGSDYGELSSHCSPGPPVHPPPPPAFRISFPMVTNWLLAFCPNVLTATIESTAIRATKRAYSTREAPRLL